MDPMRKVLVLGCSGSGKSTFAVRLHNLSGLPLYHLDNVWWKADRTHISRDEFDIKLEQLVNLDNWIIDGDYSRTYERRIAACDTIYFLDYGQEACMRGITERVGRKRGDIPWTGPLFLP
jgi:adenylate kinase family enzyme